MGSLTNYGENAAINHIYKSAYTPAPAIFLCLCTADPGETATGAAMNEAADANGYARTAITVGAPGAGSTGRRVTQNADVTFPQASGTWGAISHWAIATTSAHGAGNALAYGSFTTPFSPVSGNTPKVNSGQVWVELYNSTPSTCGMTNVGMDEILNVIFRNTVSFSPANIFLSLATNVLTSSSATSSALNEPPTGDGYRRYKALAANWTTSTSGTLHNSSAFTFASPSAYWSTIVSIAAITATYNSGTVWMYDNANVTNQSVGASDTVVIAAGGYVAGLLD